jgi:hypothetical protein
MKSTRLTALIILLVLAAAPGFAFDWGGYLDNTTGIASAPVGAASPVLLVQSTSLALWATAELGNWDLDAQGSYTFTPAIPLLFDLDRFTFGTDVIATDAGATSFGISLGRDRFRDVTGYVLNHTLDGVKLQINQARSSFRLGVGTTALLQRPTNQIVLGTLDILDLSDGTKIFAPARLIGTVDYRIIEAIAGQHLTVSATFNQDLRPEDQLTAPGTELADPTAGGSVDTQYVSLSLSGALTPGLYQTFYYTLNTGRQLEFVEDAKSSTGSWYQYQNTLGHMAGLELSYFLPEVLNSRARVFGQFSTGDSSWSDSFVPLSPSSFSDVFTLQPGNSSHLGVSYSLRPLAAIDLDILQTELRAVSYFRTSGSGEVSEPSVSPASSGSYVGSDINLIVTAVPFSDLRLVFKSGLFVPNGDVMSPENENVDYQVTLQGVLRF